MSKRTWTVRACLGALTGALVIAWSPAADAQSTRCEIPRAARDIWRCENGFVIGPENVIIRLPIPETDPEALYNAGIEAAGREDWRVAIAYFTAAHQRDHRVSRYMYNLGLAHARAGNEVPAIAWLSTYLLAEPNVPNRSAIWAQIGQLESAASARAELLWRRAQDGVRVGGSGSAINDFRASAYGELSRAFGRSGHLPRAREFSRLAYVEGNGGVQPTPEALADRNAFIALDAARTALDDFDSASAEGFFGEAPVQYRNELAGWRDSRSGPASLDVWWPLFQSSDLLNDFDGWPGLTSRSLEWRSQGYGLYQMESTRGKAGRIANEAATPIRWHAYPFLGRTQEAVVAIGRLAGGDWSGEAFDAELRSDDESMRMASDRWVTRDRGYDNLNRFVMAERSAALLGEVCLRMGDVGCAASAARLARTIADRAAREAPRMNADLDSDSPFSAEKLRAENFLGYSAVRLEALLLAENGNVTGAVDHLAVFLSRQPSAFARYGANGPVVGSDGASDILRMTWSEARFLGVYALSNYLARRERFEEALQVAEGLDSMRRQELYRTLHFYFREHIPEAPPGLSPGSVEQTPLERAIVVSRTLGGAPENLQAWLAAIENAPHPNQQIGLLAWAAEDLSRGVRRVRAIYTHAGGTWGQ